MIEYARQFPESAHMAILHDGTTPDDVDMIRSALADRVPRDIILTSAYGRTIANHVGPRALVLSVFLGPQGH
jgi:hypothetical protein